LENFQCFFQVSCLWKID